MRYIVGILDGEQDSVQPNLLAAWDRAWDMAKAMIANLDQPERKLEMYVELDVKGIRPIGAVHGKGWPAIEGVPNGH